MKAASLVVLILASLYGACAYIHYQHDVTFLTRRCAKPGFAELQSCIDFHNQQRSNDQ